ncbi:Sec-independent protein translocase protein TatB [Desulfovibrio sp. OttesenSCG-928-O18]|nr:Sec-independent protein translocase protein TatB [Desulfovibrio sp. OttesenSCG-928-O18]
MFNIGGMELLVILAVALLVLGPDKLPKFMRTVGKGLGDLRRASTDFQRTMNTELDAGLLADKQKTAPEDTAAEPLPQEQPPTSTAAFPERRKMTRPRVLSAPRKARKMPQRGSRTENGTENM